MANNNIPLVRSNSVNDINTSIIAIKKELKTNGETDINVNVDVNYEVATTVEEGNSKPVTSGAVYDYATPVDAVQDGNLKAVTSNAVAQALSVDTAFEIVNATFQCNNVTLSDINVDMKFVPFHPNGRIGILYGNVGGIVPANASTLMSFTINVPSSYLVTGAFSAQVSNLNNATVYVTYTTGISDFWANNISSGLIAFSIMAVAIKTN